MRPESSRAQKRPVARRRNMRMSRCAKVTHPEQAVGVISDARAFFSSFLRRCVLRGKPWFHHPFSLERATRYQRTAEAACDRTFGSRPCAKTDPHCIVPHNLVFSDTVSHSPFSKRKICAASARAEASNTIVPGLCHRMRLSLVSAPTFSNHKVEALQLWYPQRMVRAEPCCAHG